MGFTGSGARIIQNPVPPIYNPYAAGNPALPAMQMQAAVTQAQTNAYLEQATYATQAAGVNEYQTAFNASRFGSTQAEAYNASGVELSGSPMLLLNQTRILAKQEVNLLNQQGATQADLLLRDALATQNMGRAQLLGEEMQYETGANTFAGQELSNIASAGYSPLPIAPYSAYGNALTQIGNLLYQLLKP